MALVGDPSRAGTRTMSTAAQNLRSGQIRFSMMVESSDRTKISLNVSGWDFFPSHFHMKLSQPDCLGHPYKHKHAARMSQVKINTK